jgi:hypothetical protein
MKSFLSFTAACIIVGATGGWFLGAWPGLILGAVMGVPLALILGQVSLLVDGGLLPRAVRARTARDFLSSRRHPIARAVQPTGVVVTQREVERILERLLLESVRRSANPAEALELGRILAAGSDLAQRSKPREQALLRLLVEFLPTHVLWAGDAGASTHDVGAPVAWARFGSGSRWAGRSRSSTISER